MIRSFDYVIVGAGSAGCVLAARLSEDPAIKVALVEAGGTDALPEVRTPLAYPKLFKSAVDWDFSTDPEPHLLGRRLYAPRGKLLGGSSSINAMAYTRGAPQDFDEWASRGASGWSYADLLPYFKKSETGAGGDDRYRGRSGPLQVQDNRGPEALIDTFFDAAVAAGHARNADFNGKSPLGVGRFQLTQHDGVRCSSASAYLPLAGPRPNLHVLFDRLAKGLIIDKTRVRGVAVQGRDGDEQLLADREVIVACGAYGSPQLLMLSGIGPADALERLGLDVRGNLPVGQGLQDHPAVFFNYLVHGESAAVRPSDVALYSRERRGRLSSNGLEAALFATSHPTLSAPDIELVAGARMLRDDGLGPRSDVPAFSIGAVLLKPESRGYVALRSERPDTKPRIVNNLFSEPADRTTFLAAMRMAREIVGQDPLASRITAAARAPASDDEADLWAFAQRYTSLIYHPTSTCAIGAVVDTQLRVFGFEGLRVVDASVMPSVPRAHPNAAVIAIAERAADLIAGSVELHRHSAVAATG